MGEKIKPKNIKTGKVYYYQNNKLHHCEDAPSH